MQTRRKSLKKNYGDSRSKWGIDGLVRRIQCMTVRSSPLVTSGCGVDARCQVREGLAAGTVARTACCLHKAVVRFIHAHCENDVTRSIRLCLGCVQTNVFLLGHMQLSSRKHTVTQAYHQHPLLVANTHDVGCLRTGEGHER